MGLLSGILKAVAGPLVSGLFGSNNNAQTTTSYVDYVRLRNEAEKAGFNPLTALRNGGSAGFSTMTTTGGALSSKDFFAEALGKGVETYFNRDQIAADKERDMLERALMREELRVMQQQGKAVTSRMGFGYEIPQANNYTGIDRAGSAPDLGSGVSGRPSNGLVVGGLPVTNNDAWSSAQAFEDRYGDVLGSVYGVGVLGADIAATARTNRDALAATGKAFWDKMPKPGPMRPERITVTALADPSWLNPGRLVPDTMDEAKRIGARLYKPPRWPSSQAPTFGFFP